MMNKRVTVARRYNDQSQVFGGSSSVTKYEIICTVWAAEDFNRGTKSLREGAFDAYDIVMFRMRYHKDIDRWCLLQYQGKWYQIQSFNPDYQTNQIQITAIELANQNVVLVKIFRPVDFTLPILVPDLGGKSIVASFNFTEADIIQNLKLFKAAEEEDDLRVVKNGDTLYLDDGSDLFNTLTIEGRTIVFGEVSGGPTITKINYLG